LTSDPAGEEELQQARTFVSGLVDVELASMHVEAVEQVMAVAGTMTTLAALDLGLDRYDREAVHGHVLSAASIKDLLRSLGTKTVAERQAVPVIEMGRADVLVAGALIADVIMESGGFDEVIVSENDILDGAAMLFDAGDL
jgi:exopolyphosphatase/guanosine-5'-triphosphate,3'-diphosphate pyrophosphatase